MNTTCLVIDGDRLPHLIMKIKHAGNEATDDSSKDFSTVNGTEGLKPCNL